MGYGNFQNSGLAFIPTNAIIVDAVAANGGVKHLALMYRDTDSWLGRENPYNISEELEVRLNRLLHEDSEIIAFQNQWYRMENGIFKKGIKMEPVYKRQGAG